MSIFSVQGCISQKYCNITKLWHQCSLWITLTYKAVWKHRSWQSVYIILCICLSLYSYQMFFLFSWSRMFLLDPSIFFKSQNSLVSDDTASPVTPETSCQGTVARVTKPSAMESKITGMLLVSWDLVFLSRFNLCIYFTLPFSSVCKWLLLLLLVLNHAVKTSFTGFLQVFQRS